MEFEWDENKNEINLKKHGIDFRRAKEIWSGRFCEVSRSFKGREERVIVVGEVDGLSITVVYTQRGQNIRIISARRAHRTERAHYQNEIG